MTMLDLFRRRSGPRPRVARLPRHPGHAALAGVGGIACLLLQLDVERGGIGGPILMGAVRGCLGMPLPETRAASGIRTWAVDRGPIWATQP